MTENKPVTIYRSSQIFRQFLYNYREQLSASVLVAGWDEQLGGQVYAIPIGGFTTRQRSTASGSGSTFVQGFLDSQWKPDLTLEECKAIVKQAVGLATFRDGYVLKTQRTFDVASKNRKCFLTDLPEESSVWL